jgi:hypothetical protein
VSAEYQRFLMPCGPSTDQHHLTTCLQSQIGEDHYLRKQGTAQVEAAVALSVVVRSGPVRTAVNGTLVARPVRTDPVHRGAVGSTFDRKVRPVLDDQLPRWQGSKEPRQRPRWEPPDRRLPPRLAMFMPSR